MRLLLLIVLYALPAAAQSPHLAGKINIDLPRGTLAGDVCLSNLPKRRGVSFLLNHGLNIKAIRNERGELLDYSGYYDGRAVGEGREYTLSDSAGDAGTFCVSYAGAFPVYDKERNGFDFKGMIAFNGRTLRATEQSKWYPILYDPETEQLEQAVTYRLHVDCAACTAAYVNGDGPRRGQQTQFSSALPRPLFLYAGDFTFTEINGATYVGGVVSPRSAGVIGTAVKDIRGFYEEYLGTPYRAAPVFLTFESVDRARPPGKNTLTFASYPTVAFDGLISFDSFVEVRDSKPAVKELFWHTIAHEMAHYYFGTLLVPTGKYYWLYVETAAEYMALIAVRHFLGEETYRRWVQSYRDRARKMSDLVPLDRVTDRQMNSGNWYYYWPLLLVSLEKEIGAERMRHIMAAILNAPEGAVLDYEFLHVTATGAGVTEESWARFDLQCVRAATPSSCLD
ncbi:MAG: hypothetical protein M3444_05585 [Acidobacteriota bacterium]|nr:hypothetical protein [Acidobacteriota bacterium]